MILSRHPIVDADFFRFSLNGNVHQILYGDALAGAGVGMARVVIQDFDGKRDLAVALCVSHFHAEYVRGDADEFAGDRASQAIEAVEWIERNAASDADVVIYAGDFNTESGDLPHRILTQAGRFDDSRLKFIPTYDAAGNNYRTSADARPIAIDYIMHKSGHNSSRSGKRITTETLKIWNPLPAKITDHSDGPPISHSDHEAVAVAIGLRRTEHSDAGNASSEVDRPLLNETVELLSAASGSMYWRQVLLNAVLVVLLAVFFRYGVLNCDGSSSGIWGALWTLSR